MWKLLIIGLWLLPGIAFAIIRLQLITELPRTLAGISGMVYFQQALWAIVDARDTRLFILSPW